jgi:integration host factor subunit alpha
LSITKKVLANNISQKLGLSQKDSLFFVQNFFKALTDNRNSVININKFGTFSYKKTPKRVGRNPKTLEEFEIKSREKLTFQLSDKIKQTIN